MKKTVIADHHPLTRRGIKELLHESNNFKVVGEVSNGSEILPILEKKKPDLLILEFDMQGINGFGIFRDILDSFPKIQIVIFSSHPEEIYAARCIQSGAKGYIPKIASSNLFLKAINKIASGGIYIDKKIGSGPINDLNDNSIESRYSKLSIREIEVLDMLSAGKRNKDIALLLGINEKTVSTYKSRLLKKLKINNLAELISHSRALPFN